MTRSPAKPTGCPGRRSNEYSVLSTQYRVTRLSEYCVLGTEYWVPTMVFAVQCPNPKCRKYMLVEDDQRGKVVACLLCKTPIRVGGGSPASSPPPPPRR